MAQLALYLRAVIEWLKGELAQHRRPARAPAPELFAPVALAAAKRKAAPEGAAVKAEADANDKRSWMSSAQLWSCGSHDGSTAGTNGAAAAAKPARKVGEWNRLQTTEEIVYFLRNVILLEKLSGCIV